ncbi:YwqI/YxiC family protein [Bacillus aquiflavi]|uniref:YwqI/YxiC family protein n=1 Tax=Bacillus aquiflavi TaxID=2672567 RepID=A0A6B3VWU4_9BACI|nr:DUF5344 family protein [Bacillus aquiflavi]MBA4535600.1 YwqI/YxiC family protein [Bacillus aquiflavi]NEY79976.1 YwqI/YxiC family protein [Bacillus aquiflavi]UAC48918.1 YwqI/YxiC family protein [Bacillus aquiflavi]
MSEIKIVKNDIKSAFEELKAKIIELNTASAKADFSVSKLHVIQKIEEIEQQYYATMKSYKTYLEKSENDSLSNVELFIDVEQNIAHTISKETTQ